MSRRGEIIDKAKENLKEKQNIVNDMKLEIFNQYKSNMTEYLDKRLMEFAEQLKNVTQDNKGLSTIEINSIMREKTCFGARITYTVEELAVLFEYYIKCITLINKQKMKYPPSKKNFCAFAGVSSVTYDNWKMSDDSQRRELMMMIDDYITDTQLTSAQMREIAEITTMYRTKAEHGMYEAQAPIVVQHEASKSTSQILNDIKMMKEMKSLKTIEINENQYSVKEE